MAGRTTDGNLSYRPCKRSTSIRKISNASSKNYDGAKFIRIRLETSVQTRNPPAKAVSSVAAVALARKYNVPIRYDFTAQAPHFNYFDENGVQHEVWFEDARSIQSKFNLMKEQGIGGISYWKIGLPFPQNWRLLVENFTITKKG